jgi:hypothetical protein
LTAGDFDTVYQLGAVFDVLGMVAATERACGNPSGFELHVFDGTRTNGHVLAFEETATMSMGATQAPVRRDRLFPRGVVVGLGCGAFLLSGNKNRAGGQNCRLFRGHEPVGH